MENPYRQTRKGRTVNFSADDMHRMAGQLRHINNFTRRPDIAQLVEQMSVIGDAMADREIMFAVSDTPFSVYQLQRLFD